MTSPARTPQRSVEGIELYGLARAGNAATSSGDSRRMFVTWHLRWTEPLIVRLGSTSTFSPDPSQIWLLPRVRNEIPWLQETSGQVANSLSW
jgi:hypothetical protein